MKDTELEDFLRGFPESAGWGNTTYGLDDLDFGDFVKHLARTLAARLRNEQDGFRVAAEDLMARLREAGVRDGDWDGGDVGTAVDNWLQEHGVSTSVAGDETGPQDEIPVTEPPWHGISNEEARDAIRDARQDMHGPEVTPFGRPVDDDDPEILHDPGYVPGRACWTGDKTYEIHEDDS